MNPRKLLPSALLAVVLLLASCSSPLHDKIYDDDAAIASLTDNMAAISSIGSTDGDNGYTLSAASMSGVETLWEYNAPEDCELELAYRLSVLEGGKAKLVLVGPDGAVATISENTDHTVMEDAETVTLSLPKGKNRIRIVGFEAPKYELSLTIDEGKFG